MAAQQQQQAGYTYSPQTMNRQEAPPIVCGIQKQVPGSVFLLFLIVFTTSPEKDVVDGVRVSWRVVELIVMNLNAGS